MFTHLTEYTNYVQKLMAEYNSKAEDLKSDNREDESILFKIRYNICEIFLKMLTATDKKVAAMKISDSKEQSRTFQSEYLEWFLKIPASWKDHKELAARHEDVIAVQTEAVKLETAELLKCKFLELTAKDFVEQPKSAQPEFESQDSMQPKSAPPKSVQPESVHESKHISIQVEPVTVTSFSVTGGASHD